MEIAVVSMPSRADDSFLLPSCIPYSDENGKCQCPLGLMTHFYVDMIIDDIKMVIVSMPSRADDSFLRR